MSLNGVTRLLAVTLVLLVSLFVVKIGIIVSCLFAFLTYIATGGWEFVLICIRSGPRDVRALINLLIVKFYLWLYLKKGVLVPDLFAKTVAKYPDKLALVGEKQQWTFKQLDTYSNSVGNFFLSSGYKRGDVVAIYAESQPAYVGLWLGLAKIGLTPALVNFNLRTDQLVHSIRAATSRAVIFGHELEGALTEVIPQLRDLNLYCLGGKPSLPDSIDFDRSLSHTSVEKPPLAAVCSTNLNPASMSMRSPLFYIYTSGTTGLPKAAIVTHVRYFFMAMNVNLFFKITSSDILYTALPLYHTAGGILGTGQVILKGATMVVRRKFSASRFWQDCVANRCTVVQYIGELCRYLLAQPYRPEETSHRVRLAFGNGLRPQIWSEFQSRFHVSRIGEFYGATESNANLINPDNTVGAVGFVTRIAPFLYPVSLIRVDEATGQPIRDPRTGLCICCGPGEPGELVGMIVRGDPVREFDGYVNRQATGKKIISDVFTRGDRGFLTGDILEMDDRGYVYFRDRTGDTYRWRGENVSTSEVESIISNILHLADCVVYGVSVPGCEGRAGMAAIVRNNGLSEDELVSRLVGNMSRHLAPYARPVFLRFVNAIESTGTFKMKKIELVKSGFDPNLVNGDRLLFFDPRQSDYKPLTADVYEKIVANQIRI